MRLGIDVGINQHVGFRGTAAAPPGPSLPALLDEALFWARAFDDAGGVVINDQSGNGYDFTLGGAVALVAEAGQEPAHWDFPDGALDRATLAHTTDFDLNSEDFWVIAAFRAVTGKLPVSYDAVIGKKNIGFSGKGWALHVITGTFRELRLSCDDGTWRYTTGNSLAFNIGGTPLEIFGFGVVNDTAGNHSAYQDGCKNNAVTGAGAVGDCSNTNDVVIGAESDNSQRIAMKLYGLALAIAPASGLPTIAQALDIYEYLMGPTLANRPWPVTPLADWDSRTLGLTNAQTVSTWTDRENGYALTPVVAPAWTHLQVPTPNGKPGVVMNDKTFTNATDAPLLNLAAGSFTWIFLFESTVKGDFPNGPRWRDLGGPDFLTLSQTGGNWSVSAAGASGSDSAVGSAGPTNGDTHVVTMIWNGATQAVKVRQDGIQVLSATLTCGAISDIDEFLFHGRQYVIVRSTVWSSELTGTDLTDAEQKLMDYVRQ
jgi:hypothetical protein